MAGVTLKPTFCQALARKEHWPVLIGRMIQRRCKVSFPSLSRPGLTL